MSRGAIAIVAPLKQWGGIERKMLILCHEFVARGVAVEFILTRGGEVPYPDEFPAAVRIIDLGSRGKLDAVPRLIRHLRRSRPDAVLTAKDHGAKIAVLARALGRLRLRVVVKVTNTLSQTLRRRGKRWSAQWLYPRADAIIAISEGVRRDLVDNLGMPGDRIRVIYNPMVTPAMQTGSVELPHHPWFRAGSPPVIVAAGRLAGQKDFGTLIAAVARLRRERDCRLVILGEGPERADLEALAAQCGVADSVALPGYQSDPLPWMAGARVFALSSRYEGLGNVLVEAMAMGTPVVATDCPSGPAEILADGAYGRLVPMGDPDAMAAALGAAMDDPPDAERLREAVVRFHSGRIAEAYLETLGIPGEPGVEQ